MSCLLFLTLLITSQAITGKHGSIDRYVRLIPNAIDKSAGNVPCFKVETPTAVYFLEKEGMGLSSMLDKDGNDWIGFHKKSGSGAAGEYRGFPNAVHMQDGSFFHPKNKGTDPSIGEVIRNTPDHVTIRATSGNKAWEGLWDFYPDRCTFTMTKIPKNRTYWILYEGTPGGQYDDSDWWMTSDVKEKQTLTKSKKGDIPGPEWIAFGDRRLKRSIFLLHHEDDNKTDKFYQMQHKMTVFGFGREGITKFLDKVPLSFSIGFVESSQHAEIVKVTAKILKHRELKTHKDKN